MPRRWSASAGAVSPAQEGRRSSAAADGRTVTVTSSPTAGGGRSQGTCAVRGAAPRSSTRQCPGPGPTSVTRNGAVAGASAGRARSPLAQAARTAGPGGPAQPRSTTARPDPYVAPLVHHRVQHVLVAHQLRDDHLAGFPHEGAGRRDLPQRPVDEHRDPVGQPQRLLGPVGHVDQRGSPVAQRELDIGEEPGPGRDVQRRGGLVEEQDAGPRDQRPRQADALRLATGEGGGPSTAPGARRRARRGRRRARSRRCARPTLRHASGSSTFRATVEPPRSAACWRDVADVPAHPDPFPGGQRRRVACRRRARCRWSVARRRRGGAASSSSPRRWARGPRGARRGGR